MSGFDASWLTLREPADHAARDRDLLRAACGSLDGRDGAVIVDLGSGTGSTVRAVAPLLAARPRWRLVDNDPALLSIAGERLQDHDVETVEADLKDIEALPLDRADLVTASALFDLVSRDWLERFAAQLARRRTGLYAALSYDGRMEFEDRHAADERVVEAFNAHQLGDKGFGPALGPTSPRVLREIFEGRGFRVEDADSPWQLEPGPLRGEFLEGFAAAVGETGRIDSAELADWLAARLASPGRVLVGHRDVLARPSP